MYRKTIKYNEMCNKLANWRKAKKKKEKRQVVSIEDYPSELPNVRMRITIERFDFGEDLHVFELYKTNRVDTYNVYVDGRMWKRCGISKVMEGMIS